MKTSVKLLLILMLLMTKATAQTPGWQWLSRVGGYSGNGNGAGGPDEWVKDIKTDAQGNVYVCGRVCYGANFNGDTMTTYQGYFTLFLAKLNCEGNLVWVRTAGSTGNTADGEAYGLALDDYGNIYLTGYISANQFSPTQFFDTLITEETHDFFLAKFDTSGNYKWAKIAGPGPGVTGTGGFKIQITNDDMINVYGTGGGGSSGVFFPGYNISLSWCFSARFDTSGNINRLQNLGSVYGPRQNDYKISPTGDQYITGYFYLDSMAIGDTTLYLTNAPSVGIDLFLAKFDSLGNFKWVKQIGYPSANGMKGYGIDFIGSDVVLTGTVHPGTVIGSTTITNPIYLFNGVVPFVARFYDQDSVVWVSSIQCASALAEPTGGLSIHNNQIATTGMFLAKAVIGNDTITSVSNRDIFLSILDASTGNFTKGISLPGTSNKEEPQCITHDSSGNVYVGGCYDGTLTVNGLNYPYQGGNSDGFIAKWGTNCTVGIAEQEALLKENLFLFPNPAKNSVTLRYSARTGGIITITSAVGQIVYNEKVTTEGLSELSTQSWQPGIYFVTLQSNAGDCLVQKLIIIK